MKPQAILFDLDGTLLHSAPDFVHVINLMCMQRQLPKITLEKIEQHVSDGASAMISAVFESASSDIEHANLKDEFLRGYAQELNMHAHLYEHIDQLLKNLENYNIPWGIVTNKPMAYTQGILERFKLVARCSIVICPEQVSNTKPDPEGLNLCAKKLAIAPHNCWYIGDHERDIAAGNAANMTTVACTYGYLKNTDNAQQWGAHYVVDSPLALTKLLEKQL